ncbi:hypothetical protein ACQKMZ_28960 [Bacillus paramycoides]|uniref:hypothetical protein n=1 Tax=Bacillus paramycoides TaxID=2026194 RepID=UPI003D01A44B
MEAIKNIAKKFLVVSDIPNESYEEFSLNLADQENKNNEIVEQRPIQNEAIEMEYESIDKEDE